MKIIDCFMYYDEDMILDIRLNILDKFVSNLNKQLRLKNDSYKSMIYGDNFMFSQPGSSQFRHGIRCFATYSSAFIKSEEVYLRT